MGVGRWEGQVRAELVFPLQEALGAAGKHHPGTVHLYYTCLAQQGTLGVHWPQLINWCLPQPPLHPQTHIR